MTIDDFQAILKGKWQQSSKEHQRMGIVVLAVIQNWVPGVSSEHSQDRADPRSLQCWLMRTGSPSCLLLGDSNITRAFENYECMLVYRSLVAEDI